jgi:hypothetical protein
MQKAWLMVAMCAVIGTTVQVRAEEAAPAAAAAPAVKAGDETAALEAKLVEYFSTFKWAKDSDPNLAEWKAKKKEMNAEVAKLFDLKLAALAATDQAKADGYKANKAAIVKNNFSQGTKQKGDWKFDFEAAVMDFKKK